MVPLKWNIKKIVKEIIIASVLMFILTNIISYVRKPKLDSTELPMISVKLTDGTVFKAAAGKPLVIHFWASWCRVCKMEADNIERISKKYDVLTIAVNSGDNASIRAYLKERGLTFKVVNDIDSTWAKKFKIQAFPTTFIYDSRGKLKFTEVGYTSTAGLLARMAMTEQD